MIELSKNLCFQVSGGSIEWIFNETQSRQQEEIISMGLFAGVLGMMAGAMMGETITGGSNLGKAAGAIIGGTLFTVTGPAIMIAAGEGFHKLYQSLGYIN